MYKCKIVAYVDSLQCKKCYRYDHKSAACNDIDRYWYGSGNGLLKGCLSALTAGRTTLAPLATVRFLRKGIIRQTEYGLVFADKASLKPSKTFIIR